MKSVGALVQIVNRQCLDWVAWVKRCDSLMYGVNGGVVD